MASRKNAVEPVLSEPAARVLRRLRTVFNAVKTHFRKIEAAAGIGGGQLWALTVIRQSPGIGVGELARAMEVHQSTASNIVRSLTELGLVEAVRSGTDKRAVQLRALPAAAQVLRRAPGPLPSVLPNAISTLDAQTLARLEKDLDTLIAALHADRRGGGKLLD